MHAIKNTVLHRNRCTDLENELVVVRGKDGRESYGVWDGQGHAGVFTVDNQQGPTEEHSKLCSGLRGSLGGRGAGGEWIRVHAWLKLSQRC